VAGKIECTVTIARPCADVFDYFLNPDQYVAKGNPEVESVVRSPEGPTQPGTTFLFRHIGRPRETRSRFTAVVPDREIRFDGEVGPLRPTCLLTFAPTAGGTKVRLQADPNPIGPLKVLSPLIKRKGERLWAERLQRSKVALESPAGSGRSEVEIRHSS
jgi:uncharacterized protein YndB with AHSA1/START domain